MSDKIVLWDYDGTLVNSARKNINITKNILSEIGCSERINEITYLQSEDEYQFANHSALNWLDLYQRFFLLSVDEALRAGELWSKYQREDRTDVSLFIGIKNLVDSLAFLKQGICSQNSRENILTTLKENGVANNFSCIVGYDDVIPSKQKPHPHAGEICISHLQAEKSFPLIYYIGDHESDVIFSRNLADSVGYKVISIAVTYSGGNPDSWAVKPDYTALTPEDIFKFIIG